MTTFNMQVDVEPKTEGGELPDAASIGSELFDAIAEVQQYPGFPFRVTTLTISPEPVTS